jgi:hypothetical protein
MMTKPGGFTKSAALILIGLLTAIALAEVSARLLFPNWMEFQSDRFLQPDVADGHPALLIGKPGFQGYFAQNDGDFRVAISINAFGLRNREPVTEADGKTWVVGDSFAFGWGVASADMLSARITNAGIPAYNVASPGTNVCGYQSLVERMPKTVRPRTMIVVLTLENDIGVYDCRKRRAGESPATPAFRISLGALKEWLIDSSAFYNLFAIAVKKSPALRDALIDLGLVARPHVGHDRPEATQIPESTESTARELSALRQTLRADTRFAVLLVPSRFEVRDGDLTSRRLRLAMIDALTEAKIETIDPTADFVNAGFGKVFFTHDGHWTPLGHRIAADAAVAWLRRPI